MDYYNTLGVGKNATPDEIKKAYRKLASIHHPDKGGDTAMFQKIEEAYRILSDPQKRKEYDNPPNNFQNFNAPHGFGFSVNGVDLNDIFNSVFGQQAQRPHHTRNPVFRTQINVTLRDAFNGSTQQLKLQTQTGPKIINVDVPKGIGNGDQIKYEKVLDQGLLIIEFRIFPDLNFDRRGNDLYCNHAISVLDLIVGTTFEFTTISNKVLEINVKPKTQPHTQLKIPAQGMPIMGSNMFGDQIILLQPFIPDKIDEQVVQSILQSRNKQ